MLSSTDTMVNKTNLAPIFTVLILKQRDGSTGEHKCGLGYDWGKPGASGHRKGPHANLEKTMSHNNKIQRFYHCSPTEPLTVKGYAMFFTGPRREIKPKFLNTKYTRKVRK